MLTRREAIGAAGIGFLAALSGCSGGSNAPLSTVSLLATPQLPEGRLFVDEKQKRSDLVSPGASRPAVIEGRPLTLRLTVSRLTGGLATPLPGAIVDIWHADAIGVYSDIHDTSVQSENTLGQNWLRGYQVTDARGEVVFSTIVPGWNAGRTTHIHFKIRTYDSAGNKTSEFTSQLFFEDEFTETVYQVNPIYQHGTRGVFNTNDPDFGATRVNGVSAGTQLVLAATPFGGGYASEFPVILPAIGSP